MALIDSNDYSRLIASLDNSKIATSNNPLYQIIKQLIHQAENFSKFTRQIAEADAAAALVPVPTSGLQSLVGLGTAGEDGIDGEDGIQGPIGQRGSAGMNGSAGMDGFDGIDGIDGSRGPMGPQGLMGPIGPFGFDGIDGEDGIDGICACSSSGGSTPASSFPEIDLFPSADVNVSNEHSVVYVGLLSPDSGVIVTIGTDGAIEIL